MQINCCNKKLKLSLYNYKIDDDADENGRTESVVRPSFAKCKKYLGQFIVDCATWKTMMNIEKTKLVTSVYPQVLSDRFYPLSKGCVLQMHHVNSNKSCHTKPFTVCGYCGHSKSTAFKMTCNIN